MKTGQQTLLTVEYDPRAAINVDGGLIVMALSVISLPSGRATNGVPTGIQIVGRTFDDLTVFRAAYAYEQAAPHLFISAANGPSLGASEKPPETPATIA